MTEVRQGPTPRVRSREVSALSRCHCISFLKFKKQPVVDNVTAEEMD